MDLGLGGDGFHLKKGGPKISVGQLRQIPEEGKVRLVQLCVRRRQPVHLKFFPDGQGKTQSIFRERQVSEWENRCDTARDLSLPA